jgi:hypothetical protein
MKCSQQLFSQCCLQRFTCTWCKQLEHSPSATVSHRCRFVSGQHSDDATVLSSFPFRVVHQRTATDWRELRNAVTEHQPISVKDLNATFYLFHTEYESIALKMDVTSDQIGAELLRDRHLVCITHGYMDKYPGKQWIEVR